MTSTVNILRAPWNLSHDQRDEGAARMRNADGNAAMVVVTQNTEERRIEAYAAMVRAINDATADARGETPFVIWSNEKRAWWGPGMRGYTTDLEAAGCYSMTAAMELCYAAGPSSLHMSRGMDGGFVPAEIAMRLTDARQSTMWHRNNGQMVKP